ncbi:GNAT family N-acetyltransferase [Oligoflexus tunisiensis]|uniref:GNAT family N-acetyltransferase n=1 Tax=Oligoflexus tunisiensis TaxID=708132 RepID=UPI00114D0273|nr:GNAT family N-acetyltransferase [Oligoflexus tunisiensis]
MSLEYRTLESTPIHEIHQGFLDAFSDYIVDIRMPLPAFKEVNELRAVDYGLSMGAFAGHRLVGFTLNGQDQWQGKRTAYDAGTGVIPAWRGRGISRAIMESCFSVLEAQGFESYLLEVITSNEKAIKLYESLGFRTIRRLDCLMLRGPAQLEAADMDVSVVDVAKEQIALLEDACLADAEQAFAPSWQNSWNTIKRRPDLFRLVACLERGTCLGYGVISAGRGGIAQLWVRSDRRRQGLGSRLLRELIARSPGQKTYSWVNIDARAVETLDFLKTVGFAEQLVQLEMMRDLIS